jgi:hypothetical protein
MSLREAIVVLVSLKAKLSALQMRNWLPPLIFRVSGIAHLFLAMSVVFCASDVVLVMLMISSELKKR